MKSRAFVVDDDSRTCELMQTLLESAGMQAETETDSRVALARLQAEKFDIVFLDLRMPELDGLELAQQIRASGFNQKTPIVMITGDESPQTLAEAFQAGASFFLYKPVEVPRLMRVVRVTAGAVEQERRRFQRVEMECPVRLRANQREAEGTAVDLSLGGLQAASATTFPQDTRLEVSLLVTPGQPPVRAVGRVVRVLRNGNMGIELERISAGDKARLQDFLMPRIFQEIANQAAAAVQLPRR